MLYSAARGICAGRLSYTHSLLLYFLFILFLFSSFLIYSLVFPFLTSLLILFSFSSFVFSFSSFVFSPLSSSLTDYRICYGTETIADTAKVDQLNEEIKRSVLDIRRTLFIADDACTEKKGSEGEHKSSGQGDRRTASTAGNNTNKNNSNNNNINSSIENSNDSNKDTKSRNGSSNTAATLTSATLAGASAGVGGKEQEGMVYGSDAYVIQRSVNERPAKSRLLGGLLMQGGT